LPLQQTINEPVTVGTGDLMAKWNHKLANGSDTSLQVYFDRHDRLDKGGRNVLDTVDIDFQHHVSLGSRHDIVWGAGFRVNADHITPGYGAKWVPERRTDMLFSMFIQDEISLGHSLWLTAGSKVEHNAYTGFVLEPAVKLLWQTTERQTLWVSASQAVTQTDRTSANLVAEAYVFPLDGGGFGVGQAIGSPQLTRSAETLRDLEAGYRAQITTKVSADVATFSSYYHLNDLIPGDPFFTTNEGPPHLVLPMYFENVASAHTYGAEVNGTWQVSGRWKLSPSVSAIHMVASNENGGNGVVGSENATPQFQAHLRSSVDLTKHVEWDVDAWHVGRLRDSGDGPIPAYTRVDARLGWRIGRSAEISVVGQNLLTPLHAEFNNSYGIQRTLVERSIFAKITWHFRA
jgi:iron complex outermembrane receptor protein